MYNMGENSIEEDFENILSVLYCIISFCILLSLTILPLERMFNYKEHDLLDLCKTFTR